MKVMVVVPRYIKLKDLRLKSTVVNQIQLINTMITKTEKGINSSKGQASAIQSGPIEEMMTLEPFDHDLHKFA